jgi:hypothetical protein
MGTQKDSDAVLVNVDHRYSFSPSRSILLCSPKRVLSHESSKIDGRWSLDVKVVFGTILIAGTTL